MLHVHQAGINRDPKSPVLEDQEVDSSPGVKKLQKGLSPTMLPVPLEVFIWRGWCKGHTDKYFLQMGRLGEEEVKE